MLEGKYAMVETFVIHKKFFIENKKQSTINTE
jgi:hypothetical protein